VTRATLFVLLLALTIPEIAVAQTQPTPPNKPPEEVQRLGSLVGTWTFRSAITAGTLAYEWIVGGLALAGREEGTDPGGKYTSLRILAWDPLMKVYTLYTVSSRRSGGVMATGTLAGNTWTWQWADPPGGKPAAYRGVLVEVTPTSSTWKVERCVDGGPWTVTRDSSFTRVK